MSRLHERQIEDIQRKQAETAMALLREAAKTPDAIEAWKREHEKSESIREEFRRSGVIDPAVLQMRVTI